MAVRLADLTSGAYRYRQELREGLAHLVRFRQARAAGEAVPEEVLAFLDGAFEKIIAAADDSSRDIGRAAAHALKLRAPRGGRSSAPRSQRELRSQTTFRVALFFDDLVRRQGVGPTDAANRAREAFGLSEPSIVHRYRRKHRESIDAMAAIEALPAQLASMFAEDRRRAAELVERCRSLEGATLPVLVTVFEREDEAVTVSFPPRSTAARRRLRDLPEDARVEDIAAVCLAAEDDEATTAEWRSVLEEAWLVPESIAFVRDALRHLDGR